MGIMKELNNDRQDILKIVNEHIQEGFVSFNILLSTIRLNPTTDKKTKFMLQACITDIEKIRKDTLEKFTKTINSYNFYKE